MSDVDKEMPYARFCKFLGQVKPDPEKIKHREIEIRKLEVEFREDQKKARAFQLAGSDSEFQRISKLIKEKENKLTRLKKIYEQKDFKKAMRITGLGLKVEEVVKFAGISSFLTFIIMFIVSLILGIWLGLDLFMLMVLIATACMAVPLIVFMLVIGYPERLAKSLELEAFGSAPEIVNYMVMSMELAPSIDRALLFAAENAEGPMASELKALVWKVQTREYATTEEALAAYARELEGLNEELRSAIYNILSASKESNPVVMRSSLRRASELVLTGTRQRVEEFAASLETPAMILFGLGILLPMIIGSLLPMISFGSFDFGLDAAASQSLNDWLPAFAISVILMDIGFPAIAFFYSRSILSRRPGVHTVSLSSGMLDIKKRLPAGIAIALLFLPLSWAAGTYFLFWGIEWSISALVAISGIALAAGIILGLGTRPENRIKELEKLEDQMPDMLFQLGSRLTEGLAIEKALEEVADSMKDTEIEKFLSCLMEKLRRSRLGLEELMFSDEAGILTRHPSRKLRATMKLVVEASGKNPEMAGSMLMSMSNHMRELANTNKDMQVKLRSTIDSMRNTALFFAPVIMGVTVGLYRLLSQTFGEMNAGQSIPEFHFIMVMGVYLLMTVAIIIAFCSGIENGRGKWQRDVAVALPVSAIIFSITSLGALMAFG